MPVTHPRSGPAAATTQVRKLAGFRAGLVPPNAGLCRFLGDIEHPGPAADGPLPVFSEPGLDRDELASKTLTGVTKHVTGRARERACPPGVRVGDLPRALESK